MLRASIRALAFLLLCGVASADTRVYLVKRAEHFPQDRYAKTFSPLEYKYFIGTGRKDIDKAGGQPFRITSYEMNYDGKYAIWRVDSAEEDEKKSQESMVSKGYIIPLATFDVLEINDPTIGGKRMEPISETLSALPTDYYQHFEIDPSTPTP